MNMDLLIWLATDSKWIQRAKLNPVHLFLDFWTWTDRCVALKWKGVLKGQYKWIYECNLTGIFHRILHPSLRPSERKIEGKKDDRKWRKKLRWCLGSTCQCLCFEEMLTDHSLIFADGATMLLMCVMLTCYLNTEITCLCFLNSNSVCRFWGCSKKKMS